jgi:D-cysteine desulfhydrase
MHLARFPRRRYTPGPTPIEPLGRLSDHLGGPRLFIKRDDQLGLAGGGNKTRKLEFLVAEALERGADTLITCGAVQSNHCRLTLAAAIREGLRCRLVLEERVPGSYDPDASGNNFLFRLMGVDQIRVVRGGADLDAVLEEEARQVQAQGGTPYVIPGGGSTPLGALGYVACTEEILAQLFEMGLEIHHLVCASGSGGTHAGLLSGLLGNHAGIPVTGVSVRHPRDHQEAWIRELAENVLELIGLDVVVPGSAVTVRDEYVGPGYSLPTEGMVHAVQSLARLEGVLLDPVYTGKAMDGLIGMVRSGVFARTDNVLFLHTGGSPGLFAYQSTLLETGCG